MSPKKARPHARPGSRGRTGAVNRWTLFLTAIAVVAALAGVFVSVLILGRGPERVDRASARAISSVVSAVSRAMGSALGDAGAVAGDHGWRGLRVYEAGSDLGSEAGSEAGSDAWTTLDELGPGAIVADGDGRAVLLIHGLDEPGGIWDQLAPALHDAGHRVIRFDYANDQAVIRTTDELLEALADLGDRGVERLDIVSHSMGGLVARDALTRPRATPGLPGVDRLITLGTPHAGSPWARLQALAEAREQVQRWAESDDRDPRRLLGFINDGVGEAGRDLLPGSDFLVDLNERSLPAGVRVTCIVGRIGGGPGDGEADGSAAGLGPVLAAGVLDEILGKRDAGVIRAEMAKISRELGDGVVPLSSAVMAGAEDIVVVHANHRSMVRNIELGEAIRDMGGLPPGVEPPAIEIVLDRLERD